MNAIEFVKEFGIGEAKRIINSKSVKLGLAREIADWKNPDFEQLKQIVDAFELVELNCGLKEAIEFTRYSPIMHPDVWELIDAIELVEQCNV